MDWVFHDDADEALLSSAKTSRSDVTQRLRETGEYEAELTQIVIGLSGGISSQQLVKSGTPYCGVGSYRNFSIGFKLAKSPVLTENPEMEWVFQDVAAEALFHSAKTSRRNPSGPEAEFDGSVADLVSAAVIAV
ncbi:hypothetical protein HPB52_010053 [Rhipicephalus sanguineus]|uniref:Uncharacterized protein n=1 Tax=Rhipicephalus sanguineus TaxID=34632 RepID=A0A9D4T3L6_RHISA|nr:hypothetical protein HPB52_010053 [Rhipicephalus sanguineus]